MKVEIIENIKERMKDDNAYVVKVLKGKKNDTKRAEKTLVITPDIFAKIFSPERIKLMLKVRKNKITSIYQLAKALNRKYEAVYRDIKLLEGFGIITLKEKDNQMIPTMESVEIPSFAA